MSEIANNSPLIIGKYPNQQKLSRRFLGNLFPDKGVCIERKELQAYLKGQTHFTYKRDEYGNQMFYKVRQEYFYV